MIIHREAQHDLRAYKIAEVFDRFGLTIISIHQDQYNYWRIWAQGPEVDTAAIDAAIDPPEEEE